MSWPHSKKRTANGYFWTDTSYCPSIDIGLLWASYIANPCRFVLRNNRRDSYCPKLILKPGVPHRAVQGDLFALDAILRGAVPSGAVRWRATRGNGLASTHSWPNPWRSSC